MTNKYPKIGKLKSNKNAAFRQPGITLQQTLTVNRVNQNCGGKLTPFDGKTGQTGAFITRLPQRFFEIVRLVEVKVRG